MTQHLPIQSYHSLEFDKIPQGQEHDDYALAKIRDVLISNMNPQLSRGIIFLNNRKKCEDYAEKLEQEFAKLGRNDLAVGFYHAGMAAEERSSTESEFRNGEKVVIFATKAFGMGIDIPNIHFVFHQRPPSNLENYLQEIGRAGRDSQSRERAGMDKVRCILFYSENSFAKAKTRLQTHRLHWSDLESMRLAIAEYRQQQANPNHFIIPVDLIKESNDLKDKNNPETTQRMLLYWLEELGKIKLGDRVVSHINLSLGLSANISSPLVKLVEQKGGSREKTVSILISTIQDTLNLSSVNQVLTALFQAHQREEIRVQRNLRIKMTKFGIEESEKQSYKLHELAQFKLKKISLNWQDKQEISCKDLQFLDESDRLGKSWPKMVRLLNRLNGISFKSKANGVQQIRIISQNSTSWRKELKQIHEICPKLLAAIQENYERQETINLGDLMALTSVEHSHLFKASLSWLRDLGYIRYEQDFIPMSLELHINDEAFESSIVDPSTRPGEREVQQRFEDYHLLKEWRLNALAALIEHHTIEQRVSFIQQYFACKNIQDIEELILNQLPEMSWLGSQLRLEAFTKEMNQLNHEQKHMVEACVKKSLIVTAGPGTGKTRTLLLCVANLIVQERENPDDILVLAYNTAVVAELRSRLSTLLRDLGYASSYNRLHIYTFHSYVRRTLGDRLPPECTVEHYLEEYLSMTKTNKSLLRPNGREAPHYIFIDEYQDVNKQRYQMLLRIKGDNTHLIAIGDDDQSIYGYERKSSKDDCSPAAYFTKFEDDFQATSNELTINYRSGPEILEKANQYIKRNSKRRRHEPLTPGRSDITGNYSQSSITSAENPLEQILARIEDILKHNYSSAAVLFRTNAELYRVLGSIQKRFQGQAQIHVQGGTYKFASLRQIAVLLDKLKSESDRRIDSFQPDFLTYIGNTYSTCKLNLGADWDDNAYHLLVAAACYFQAGNPGYSTISELIDYIYNIGDFSELLRLKQLYSTSQQQVKTNIILSTIHKIKGLEFDAVLVPPADCNLDQEAIEEERRLRYVAMTRARDYLHLMVGEREKKLFNGKPIKTQKNPQIGLKFDSGSGYDANNDKGGRGMLTLFTFAQDEYAYKYTNHRVTQGTGEGLQWVIFKSICEGDDLELHWQEESRTRYNNHQENSGYYHLYHCKLQTKIARVTRANSKKICDFFQKEDLRFNSLVGIYVTNVSRFRVPNAGEDGSKYNSNLCSSVLQEKYYYIVDCAGYLQAR